MVENISITQIVIESKKKKKRKKKQLKKTIKTGKKKTIKKIQGNLKKKGKMDPFSRNSEIPFPLKKRNSVSVYCLPPKTETETEIPFPHRLHH